MSNLNGAGCCAGNGANGSAGPGGNSGPEPVRHGWFCCCIYCLIGTGR